MYPYSGRPDKVIRAIELGFDLFTGCYPFLITMKNEASLFEFEMSDINEEEEAVPTKRRRLNSDDEKPHENEISIDLSNKK